MGCAHSLPDTHPSLFKARNLNDKDKSVNSVLIEVRNSKVIVHSRGKKVMATWPIACLRRYGCNNNILFIETGSGCDSGHGMYLFKCSRTDQIFELLKKHWNMLQRQQEAFGPHNMGFPQVSGQTVISTTNQNQQYYNMNNSSGTHHVIPNGRSEPVYTNGNVRLPSTSSNNATLPVAPSSRGSTSSQHGSTLAVLPEERTLSLTTSDQPFALQPAPTTRQEMKNRKRINSEMAVASYSRRDERVTIARTQRRNSESANYQNTDVIFPQSGSFPRQHRVLYDKKTQKVKLEEQGRATFTSTNNTNPDGVSPTAISSGSCEASLASLRSDFEPLLTPGSKSSGIGSLSGNGSSLSSQNPPPLPPPISDPWRRQPQKFGRFHNSPSRGPQSARDYVNTINASMDVSGTPLPATAVGGMHFSFDFDASGFPNRYKPGGYDRSKQLNYVPVEAFKTGEDFNCGASSASSGIPGTPGTPTPKTPLASHPATDYAIIDHKKTQALSNTHRSRQSQRKPRHGKKEKPLLNSL